MSFAFTDEDRMLEDTVSGFFEEYGPQVFRKMRNSGVTFSKDHWDAVKKLGLHGLMIDSQFGGSNMSFISACVVADAIGKNLSLIPFISSAVLAPKIISMAGSKEQKANWLSAIVEGNRNFCIEVNEPLNLSGTDNNLVLSGTLKLVKDANHSTDMILLAKKDDKVYLLQIDLLDSQIQRTAVKTLDSGDYAMMACNNIEIGPENIIGHGPVNGENIEKIRGFSALIYAAELLGSARSTFDMTLEYLKERKQFERIIGSFQALQHRASLLFLDLSLAEALIIKAARLMDEESPESIRYCSLAKAKANQAASLIANEAIQMHGGVGMTDEYDLGLFVKRISVVEKLYGDYNYHADKAAQLSGY